MNKLPEQAEQLLQRKEDIRRYAEQIASQQSCYLWGGDSTTPLLWKVR